MKVVAFNGSPRKNGNTHSMIEEIFTHLIAHGFDCEEINIAGKPISGCRDCRVCKKTLDNRCVITSDDMNLWIEAMRTADVVLLASPTYFATITTEMKALIDRAGRVSGANGGFLKQKVGAPIVVARRGGAIQTYNTLMAFFGITSMIVPMSSYWNMGYGLEIGDVKNDTEAMLTMKNLAENIAHVLKK